MTQSVRKSGARPRQRTHPMCPKLPHKPWQANTEQWRIWKGINSPVGKIIDAPSSLWVKEKYNQDPRPRSEYHPDRMFEEQFTNYWDDPEIKWNEDALRVAIAKARDAFVFSDRPLVPLKTDKVPIDDKLTKSAGLPSFGRKKDQYTYALGRASAIATGRVAPAPCAGFHRTQENQKVRLVWGFPFEMTLLEGRFAIPWLDVAVDRKTPYTVGMISTTLQGRLRSIEWAKVKYCLDWSKFDSTAPRRLINAAFDIIEGSFNADGWSNEVRRVWEIVKLYFKTCPILMPDGFIYHGRKRGIPSGSWLTQIVGSIVNYIAIHYIIQLTGDIVNNDVVVYGDDSVLGMETFPDVVKWAEVASSFGMRISPHKQHLTHSARIHFLGHTWGGLVPTRPVEETLNKLVTSERAFVPRSKDPDDRRLEYQLYIIEKAKALMIDNPDATEPLVRFIAWRMRVPYISVWRGMNVGPMCTSPALRAGMMHRWKGGVDPFQYSSPSSRTIGQTMLAH